MGQNAEEVVKNINVRCLMAGIVKTEWTVLLAVCCVMVLTLVRYRKGWSEQESAAGWCITMMGLMAVVCVCKRKQMTKWGVVDTLVMTAMVYYMVNTIFLSHFPVAHQVIITMECGAMYIFVRIIVGDKLPIKGMVYVMAAAGVYESIVGMLQLAGLLDMGCVRGQMTGTFLNPGPMSIYIAVMLSACTCYYRQTHDRVIGCSMIPMLIIMPAAWSRTALLAYGIVVVLLFRSFCLRHWKISLAVILSIVAGLYLIKRGSADSRTLMNIVAMNEWKEHPWWGYGTGGYMQALAQGQMKYFAVHPDSKFVDCVGTTDMAFNEYIKVIVENGIVGIVLVLSVVGWSLWCLAKENSPIVYAMTALYIAALFSYPFHLFPFMILASWFVAMAAGCGTTDSEWGLWKRMVAAVCMLILVGLTIVMNREVDRRKNIVKGAESFAYIHEAVFIDDYYELLPEMNDNREYLFGFAKTLREAGRYNDSNAILRMETQLDTDPMAYVVMGRNYEDMSLYAEADSFYLQAFLLQPNRIYPLYRQMRLYERIGDVVRMDRKAREIIAFTPKVMSPAVMEMKEDASELITPSGNKNKKKQSNDDILTRQVKRRESENLE